MTPKPQQPGSDPAAAGIGRRAFLGGSLLAALTPVLAACSGDGALTPGGPTFGAASLRLSWLRDVAFAGSYLADVRGYYTNEGFGAVSLLPGGADTVVAEADVAAGKARFGIGSPVDTAAAIGAGADLAVIGAQFQRSPYCIVSRSSAPIASPAALAGKRIGVPPVYAAVWRAFVAAAGLDTTRITTVAATENPSAGGFDGYLGLATREPIVLARQEIPVVTMLLADHGLAMIGSTYVTTRALLRTDPDTVKAFLRAEVKGWTDNLAAPSAGADLAVKYGAGLGLDRDDQVAESQGLAAYQRTDATGRDGLFTVADALVQQTIGTLRAAGFDIAADQLLDLRPLREIFVEDPSLLA